MIQEELEGLREALQSERHNSREIMTERDRLKAACDEKDAAFQVSFWLERADKPQSIKLELKFNKYEMLTVKKFGDTFWKKFGYTWVIFSRGFIIL